MKRRIRRALKRAGLYNAFHITLIAVLLTGFCVILFNVKEPEQQEKEPEEIQAEVMQNPETMTQTAENIEDKYKVFDTMSEDWGSDDLEGFVFYDLPEQYADKGYFPEKMQIYTRCLCKQYDVPYALVLAIIEQESGYEFDKTGDGGQSKGYMQIYEKWHTDRMQNLGCTDLMNPCYTGNLRAALKAAGFEVLTENKYLTSDAYLLAGDILLNDGAHTATNLTDGAKSSGAGASNTTPVKSNTKVDVAHGFNKSLAGTYKVTASGLNLRAGAGTGKSILAVMNHDEKVQYYGYYNDCNGVKWLYVVYKNIVGYASSKYLSK